MAFNVNGYNVAGAGTTADNGLFAKAAGNDANGNAYAQFGTKFLYYMASGIINSPCWNIGPALLGTSPDYVSGSGQTAATVPLTGWGSMQGASPAPTLTAATAPTAPTTAPVLTATGQAGANSINTVTTFPTNATLSLFKGSTTGGESAVAFASGIVASQLPYVDGDAPIGTAVFYTAKFVNSVGSGPASSEVSATATAAGTGQGAASIPSNIVTGTPNAQPMNPYNLTGIFGNNFVTLNWTNPVTLSSATVRRRVTVQAGAQNVWTNLQTLAATTQGNPATVPASYTDNTAVNGTTYDYEIVANP